MEDGVSIHFEVILEYGCNIRTTLTDLKAKVKKEIDRLTAMNVVEIQVLAKELHVKKD